MVTQFGMSDKVGPMTLGRKQHEVFLGRDIVDDRNYSEEVAFVVDQEVRSILEGAYEKVRELLTENREKLDRLAETLLAKEVIEASELDAILNPESLEANKSTVETPPPAGEEQASSELSHPAPAGLNPSVEPA